MPSCVEIIEPQSPSAPPWCRWASRGQNPAVEQVVGGEGESVDWAQASGLRESQGGRDHQLEAQPDYESVRRSCPPTVTDRAGERAVGRSAGSAEGPVGGLD